MASMYFVVPLDTVVTLIVFTIGYSAIVPECDASMFIAFVIPHSHSSGVMLGLEHTEM